MPEANRPVTSREYKLMLKPELFLDRKSAVNTFRNLVKTLVKREKGDVQDQSHEKPKDRITWYMDSEGDDLKRLDVSLRVRKEKKVYKVNLKYRTGDRYLSARAPVNKHVKDKDCKFEEDVTPVYVSKFSHSGTIELKKKPKLKKMKDAITLFPGLKEIVGKVPAKTPLVVVNDFKAREYCHYLLKAHFGGNQARKTDVNMCMSFWYFKEGKHTGYPLAAEFSYDFEADKSPHACTLEVFPKSSVLEACNKIFKSMLNMDAWIKTGGTTKTVLAYDGV